MIALEHDPEKPAPHLMRGGDRFTPCAKIPHTSSSGLVLRRAKPGRKRSCSKKKLERDDGSKTKSSRSNTPDQIPDCRRDAALRRPQRAHMIRVGRGDGSNPTSGPGSPSPALSGLRQSFTPPSVAVQKSASFLQRVRD